MIDRGSIRTWQQNGGLDAFGRAKEQTKEILSIYQRPELPEDKVAEMQKMVEGLASEAGMDTLPALN